MMTLTFGYTHKLSMQLDQIMNSWATAIQINYVFSCDADLHFKFKEIPFLKVKKPS